MGAFVHILRCSDGSYYTGSARGDDLDRRISEHQQGVGGDYTRRRLPVILVWHQYFDRITDAVVWERQLKGWSRAKKEAMIRDKWDDVSFRAKRPSQQAKLSAHATQKT
ncbi:MAG: GIY-YIG nuclease family protein [Methylocystis sp.]|nr:GIY-YIG nuclease family protein [Methylocystis sp.]MBI3275039.1 GIY-YIG nuclease family protein [Methylocystis sp.]